MLTLPLQTKNCIVTGKPATVFSGHVLAKTMDGQGNWITVSIIAGWADSDVGRGTGSRGCYGEWKPEYGIDFDSWCTCDATDL